MKEKPILFSGPMVCAILEGRKTQTRRVVKPEHLRGSEMPDDSALKTFGRDLDSCCPHGRVGDRLWVKETWTCRPWASLERITFRADGESIDRLPKQGWTRPLAASGRGEGWVSSLFMPQWASRITLEIVSVRVERLQEINEKGCSAEGIKPVQMLNGKVMYADNVEKGAWLNNPVLSYATLWDSINGPGSWSKNPWVWVIEFKRI